MWDWLNWDWWQQNALIVMFFSAFLSATVLPGNSEIIFLSLATPRLLLQSDLSADIFALVLTATIGNSLGSLTTYCLGRWLPAISSKNDRTLWVLQQCRRYGALTLLFGWLPVIGDLICAAAGWLRLSWWKSVLFITLGKLIRYLLLLFLNTAVLF